MSLKVVLAGLSATALIAAPLVAASGPAFAQEPPSAPIPYSELAAKDAAMDKDGMAKGKHHHHHHKAKAEKAEKAADKPAEAGH